ncbi:MAG: outer membrane protein assembly factor BamA [Deltaproteobacteria bacterium]|nr:outer membrane protein assembly factor BamA [Deltaproteobacteria bacterium]
MRKCFYLIPFLFCLVWVQSLYGQAVRIAIVPFTFHSVEDLSGLQGPLLNLFMKSLRKQGFQPISAKDALQGEAIQVGTAMTDALARAIGRSLECDFVLYGSLSKFAEQISLDVRLVDVKGARPTASIYAVKVGLENLASAVADVVAEISIRVYRKKKIYEIVIRGNRRVEDEAIKLVIHSKPGQLLDQAQLRKDLTAIYKMGYFTDVRIETEDTPQGQKVIFVVVEKPTINKVVIHGAHAVKEDDIRGAIATKPYTILKQATITEDMERIRALYRDKGYYNAKVTYEVQPLKGNAVVVKFNIKEHQKLYIRKIIFTGNHEFSDKELKKKIKTSEKGFFFWLTESGILKQEQLDIDVDRLAAFYHNQGFVDAKVGSPVITYDDKGINIEFPIFEGKRFRVGKVKVTGIEPEDEKKLQSSLKLPETEYFSREVLARDIEAITNYYTDKGYAFAEVIPRIRENPAEQLVDVDYEVNKGQLVYFGRITISGNTKTRDKVIRRELRVVEQGRYDKAKLQRSVQNLRRLDYFEGVAVDTMKGKKPNEMDLNVKVKEKPTSFVSLGAGYSSADKVFVAGQIAERNLFGRGQQLQFQGQFGKDSNRFMLQFTEPWLFDMPLSTSVSAYRWFRDYDEYSKESYGGKLGFGYPVWDYTRLYMSYGYDHSAVQNVSSSAADFIKDQKGTIISSVISTILRRDSRDHPFFTTRGSDNSLTLDFAGLGGDAGYIKAIFNSGWYYPLFWKFVGFLHGKIGFIEEVDGMVPIYERFFLGGINSIRSFGSGDVSPRDRKTGDRIGGNKMALFNAELLFPLIESQGLRGVIFFDAGNSYDNGENIDISKFKLAVGGGFRWQSPMGPLRLEWGLNPSPSKDESRTKWQFSMGVYF